MSYVLFSSPPGGSGLPCGTVVRPSAVAVDRCAHGPGIVACLATSDPGHERSTDACAYQAVGYLSLFGDLECRDATYQRGECYLIDQAHTLG